MKLTAEQTREITERYTEGQTKFRDVGACTLRDISALFAHIAQLEAENAALREAERWIPVGERLPEHNGFVLTYLDIGICDIAHYNKHIWQGESIDGTVTHWRPLPQPPEAAENALGGGEKCT